MVLTGEQKCLLWLSCGEIAAHHAYALMAAYGGAQGIWDSFGKPGGPSFQPIARQKLERLHSRDAMDDECDRLGKLNVHLLFRGDDGYPDLLDAIDDPPYLLYYAGRLSCLSLTCVAVVGTRSPSAYGREMSRLIAQGLSEAGVCVVSGLALGIDAEAHTAVLEAAGHTVGILGSGINAPYPSEHRGLLRRIAGGVGLIMSEYPLDAEPLPYHFPHRNRIISGLSVGTVFVEGRIKSGGMRTVMAALAQGREVFAVPGRVGTLYSEGPHTILREGARIVTCAQDILDDLGIGANEQQRLDAANALSPAQQRIVDALHVEPMNLDELSQKLEQSADALITEIGMLEILGMVSREAGNRFATPISGNRQRRS